MEPEKIRQLIYTKGFDTRLTQRFLRIADSSMVIEDLLELIDEEKDVEIQTVNTNDCSDCEDITEAESERDDARDGRVFAEKKFKDLQKNIRDLIVKFEDQAHQIQKNIRDLIVKFEDQAHQIISGVTPSKRAIPESLVHVKCECGNELFIDGKQKGWKVDFQGPCGKTIVIPTDTTPLTLCTACEAVDKNNPPCSFCDRPVCPECEADNTDDPPVQHVREIGRMLKV